MRLDRASLLVVFAKPGRVVAANVFDSVGLMARLRAADDHPRDARQRPPVLDGGPFRSIADVGGSP